MGALHKITRRLCETRQICSTVISDRKWHILTTDREQAARWVEHFKSQSCALNLVTHPPASKDMKTSEGTPTFREAKDAIHAEMLKVDLPTSVGVLFNEVWECKVEDENLLALLL